MIRYTAMALSVVIALLVWAPAVFAQMDKLRQSTPRERARIQTDMMKAELGQSPDQLTKVATINEKYAQQMQPIIRSSEGSFMRMRQMREVSTAKEAELKGVLSPDQFQKCLAEKGEMKEKLRGEAPQVVSDFTFPGGCERRRFHPVRGWLHARPQRG
jgi:hypothetical protein